MMNALSQSDPPIPLDDPTDVEDSASDFAPQLSDLAAVQALDGVDADTHIDPPDVLSPVVETSHIEPLRETRVQPLHDHSVVHEDTADDSLPELVGEEEDDTPTVSPLAPADTPVTVHSAPADPLVTAQPSARPTRDRRPPKYLQDYITLAHTDPPHYVYNLSVKDAIAARGEQTVMNSINDEFASLYIEMKALDPCFTNEHALPLHLVLTEKFDAKQTFDKMKARIVIGGNLQEQIEDIITSSYCVRQQTIFLLLGVAAHRNLYVRAIDVKTAYLHAAIQSRNVYARMRKALADLICQTYPELNQWRNRDGSITFKVLKAIYGLAEAARQWYLHLAELLGKFGFKPSTNDKALFHLSDATGVMYILVYVDDLLIIGDSEVLWNKLLAHLNGNLKGLTIQMGPDVHFLRMLIEVRRSDKGPTVIYASRIGYLRKLLEKYRVTRNFSTPCTMDVF